MMVDNPDLKHFYQLGYLNIRQVKLEDLPALEWDGEYSKYRRMYGSLFRDVSLGRALMWMVETQAREMVGQAFVLLRSSERAAADGERRAYVFSFRIKPDYRSQGIGTYLMGFVQKDLRERGYKFITLNVAKENPDALRLYKRLGYKVIGSHPGKWSYTDHEGKTHQVNEPAWRMIKRIGE
jgi:ribosomal protein S18 acetylase RimI-like enzyme